MFRGKITETDHKELLCIVNSKQRGDGMSTVTTQNNIPNAKITPKKI